jgi:hypothetical protein
MHGLLTSPVSTFNNTEMADLHSKKLPAGCCVTENNLICNARDN